MYDFTRNPLPKVVDVKRFAWQKVTKGEKYPAFKGGDRYCWNHEVLIVLCISEAGPKQRRAKTDEPMDVDDDDDKPNDDDLLKYKGFMTAEMFPFRNDKTLDQEIQNWLRVSCPSIIYENQPYKDGDTVLNAFDKGAAFAEWVVSYSHNSKSVLRMVKL